MPTPPSRVFPLTPTSPHLTVGEEDELLVCVTRKQCVSKLPPLVLSEASPVLPAGALTLMDEHFKVSRDSQAALPTWLHHLGLDPV